MSKHRYVGGIISSTLPTPSQSSASGVWTLDEAQYYQKQGNWPAGSGADPYFQNNVLLLHGDGTNGAQNNTFLDSSTNNFTITRNGNTTQGSVTPYVGPGCWSDFYASTSSGWQTPANSASIIIGSAFNATATFTVEAWIYPLARHSGGGAALGYVFGQMQIAGSAVDWSFGPDSNGNLVLFWYAGGNQISKGGSVIPLNTWTHIALSVSNGAIRMFVNGVQETLTGLTSTTASSTTTNYCSSGGYLYAGSTWQGFNGYISNLRVIAKRAAYTTGFAPSTTPLIATSDTTLLTNNQNGFRDLSGANWLLTTTGGVQVSKFSPFTFYQTVPTNYSGYFDGTGDYLSIAAGPATALGSGDFTVEYWAFYNTFASSPIGFDSRSSSGDIMPSDYVTTGGNLVFYYNSTNLLTSTNAAVLGRWNHIAWVRSGNLLTSYINGVASGSVMSSTNFGNSQPFRIAGNITAGNFLNGSISNFRVVKGTAAYTANFTPSTVPLTTTTTVPATQSNSLSFDGSGDYAALPTGTSLQLSNGDFTIEAWVYPTARVTNAAYIISQSSYGVGSDFAFWITSTGILQFYMLAGGGSNIVTSTGTVALNAWTHVAVVRSGNLFRLYINGVNDGTLVGNQLLTNTYTPATIANSTNNAGSVYFPGSISNLRVVKGTAVYTANFTPSTSDLTTTTTVPVTQSNSVTFDGSGDYLTFPQSSLQFGANDFTVEAWVYFSSIVTDQYIFNYASSGPTHVGINYYSGAWRIGGFNSYLITGGTASAGQWYHVAMVRSGSILRAYINGVQIGSSVSVSGVTFNASGVGYIGAYYASGSNLNGFVSNLRITNGQAVYTANFTPPTSALTTTTTVPSNQSNSVTFDGNGDYLTTPANAAFAWGTGDFTVELWFNTNAAFSSARTNLVGTMGSGGGLFAPTNTNMNWNSFGVGDIMTAAFVPTVGQWYHLAYSRSGTTGRLFVNGALLVSGTDSTNYTNTTFSVGYSSAQYLNAFISNLRVVKGQALYTSAFTPSTTPLTLTSQGATDTNVSLLTCQDRLLEDNSLNYFRITPSGDARPSSANPFVTTNGIGGTSYSGLFNGSSQNLSVASNATLTLGSGAFTIESWVYISGSQTQLYGHQILGTYAGASNGYALVVNRSSNGLGIIWANGSPTGNIATYGTYLNTNTWYHIAVVRTSTATNGLTIYLNGVAVATGTDATNDAVLQALYIGSQGSGCYFPGYISNVRITKGQALYTANFSPSTAPLTTTSQGATASNVSLLTCQSTTFIDNSPNAFTITNVGTTPTNESNPFSGATTLLTGQSRLLQDDSAIPVAITPVGDARPASANPFVTTNGVGGTSYSGYFNGSSYLSAASNAAFGFGTGDFTVEYWINGTSWASNPNITDFRTGAGASGYSDYITSAGFPAAWWHDASRVQSTIAISTNTWNHVAFTRQSGTVRVFVNGVLGGTATAAQDLQATVPCRIGATVSTTNYFTGNLSNFRAIKGTALYTSSFSPPTSPLTAISGTSFLTCQSTTFIDNSINAIAITNTGSVVTDEFNPFSGATTLLTGQSRLMQDNSAVPRAITSFGDARPSSANPFVTTNGIGGTSYSAYFDGTGDYVTVPVTAGLGFGTGNFTWEAWIYPSQTSAYQSIYDNSAAGDTSATGRFLVDINAGGVLRLMTAAGTVTLLTSVSGAIVANQWQHIAITRSGTTGYLFINGALVNTATVSTNFLSVTASGTNRPIIGAGGYNPTGAFFSGYMSNMRAINGTALYISGFSPSTAPLTAVTNTQLLIFQNTTFVDNSVNNLTISVTGDTRTDEFNPFSGATTLLTCQSTTFIDNSAIPLTITANGNATPRTASPFTDTVTGPTPYAAATYGGSAYFDGTGDYLGTPTSGNLAFGANDFTMEGYFYFLSRAQSYPTIFGNDISGGLAANIWSLCYDRTDSAGSFRMFIGNINTISPVISVASPYSLYNRWAHIALTRRSNVIYLYVDGTQITSYAITAAIDNATTAPYYISYPGVGCINAYASNFRVVKGTAVYTGPFVPPAAPVTAVTSTQLLLNGTNAGIFDNTTVNDLETVGSAQVSTSVVKYGTGSIYFNGLNSYLFGPNTPDLNFGSGNFTIEGWFYSISVATNGLISKWTDGGNQRGWKLDTQSAGTMTFYYSTTGSDFPVVTFSGASLDANTWTHLALVRNGSTLTLYKNGTSIGSSAFTATIFANNSQSCIGGWFVSTGTPQTVSVSPYNGYMDDIRVTKGVARYTANFTPPAGPFPNY